MLSSGGVTLNLFSRIEAEHIQAACKKSPCNAFEEAMEWTQEGKMWKFPIDNEQGTFTLQLWLARLIIAI